MAVPIKDAKKIEILALKLTFRYLGGTVNELDEKKQRILGESWAETFRQEVFLRIDESVFEAMYSEKGSRPNLAVNVLVGWEIIKVGQGLSDRAMHERFLFDIQVRHALGLDGLNEGYFELRTVYNFRKRVLEYEEETGRNVVKESFSAKLAQTMINLPQMLFYRQKMLFLNIFSAFSGTNRRRSLSVGILPPWLLPLFSTRFQLLSTFILPYFSRPIHQVKQNFFHSILGSE